MSPKMKQPELLKLPSAFEYSSEITSPLVWVKELRVYESPDHSKWLRRVELRCGLNVVWSHAIETNTLRRISGHSAGKSTFCRFLRYVLGEENYASKDKRKLMRNALPEGLIVAEVVIDNVSWVVKRSLESHRYDAAIRNKKIESWKLYEFPEGGFERYAATLNQALRAKVANYPLPERNGAVEWSSILPWLTRDQECRLDSLTSWRIAATDSGSPEYNSEINSFIVRAVLGLMSAPERRAISEHSELKQRKAELDRMLPQQQYHIVQLSNEINTSLGLEAGDGSERLFWEKHEAELKADIARKRKELQVMCSAEGTDLSENLKTLNRERGKLQEQLESAEDHLQEDEKQYLKSLGLWTKEKSEQERQKRRTAPVGRCNFPLDLARKNGCQWAKGQTHDFESRIVLEEMETDQQSWEKIIDKEKKVVQNLGSKIQELDSKIKDISDHLNAANKLFDQERLALLTEIADSESMKSKITQTLAKINNLEDQEKEFVSLPKEIKESLDILQEYRSRNARARGLINEVYAGIISQLLGKEVTGKVIFHADRIEPQLDYHGNLDSVTLNILKTLAFDYACLKLSAGDIGGHPRFLIHDSPKEADMEAAIYEHLFKCILKMEKELPSPAPFQYIITTTAPPPDESQLPPYLICELDAAQHKTRFLGLDV